MGSTAERALVLSIFPGLGLLDRAFESEGFTVVRGPDPIWGGDIRDFHPPAGVFHGVIGGDPCQSHSALANLVRAKGLQPTFPDLSPEFERVVSEAWPLWFLRENVPQAPDIALDRYGVHSFLLDNAWLDSGDGTGEEQMRRRRFWFGVHNLPPVDLRRWIEFAALSSDSVAQSVTGRRPGEIGRTGGHRGSPAHYSLEEMLRLQGLPQDYLDHCPLTVAGKRRAIGNGVPQAMGRALARAILRALYAREPAA